MSRTVRRSQDRITGIRKKQQNLQVLLGSTAGPMIDGMDVNQSFSGRLEAGDDIIATKWIALKGSAEIVKVEYTALREYFSDTFLRRVMSWEEMISVYHEKKIASRIRGTSFYEASESGIFGALWDYAAVSEVGLEIELRKIPILQETIEITEIFNINPYQFVSNGCLLIGTKQGSWLAEELEKTGIRSSIIGKATKGNDRIIKSGNEHRYLTPPNTDGCYNMK